MERIEHGRLGSRLEKIERGLDTGLAWLALLLVLDWMET